MNTNCNTESFKKGLKAVFKSSSSYLRDGGTRHIAVGVLMGFVLAAGAWAILTLTHALIMTLGMAKIELLSLPIDTAGESIWPGYMLQQEYRVGSTRKIFEHGTSVFMVLILILGTLVGGYVACKRICKMGQTELEANG